MAFKLLIFTVAIACARAGLIAGPAIAAPLAAVPAVAAVRAIDTEYDPNPQYSYAYDVQDALTGDNKSQQESRSGDVVQGQYSLVEPDGTRRIVDYTADPINGFNAIVRKEALTAIATPIAAAPAVIAARVAAPTPVIAARIAAPLAVAPAPIARVAAVAPAPLAYQAPFAPITRVATPFAPVAQYARYAAPLAPAPLGYSAPLAPAPLAYSAPLAPAPLAYSAPLAPAPFSYSAPLAPAPFGYSAPFAPAYGSAPVARIATPYGTYVR